MKNVDHVRQLVDSVLKNMLEGQPTPVRFQAACAMEKISRNERAKEVIQRGISVVLNAYLSIINDTDNSDVRIVFASVMSLFKQDVKPIATDICNFLK